MASLQRDPPYKTEARVSAKVDIPLIRIYTVLVRVSRRFQITIPSEIRRKLGIREGDYVDVELDEREGVFIVRPCRRKRCTPRFGRGLARKRIDETVEEDVEAILSGY
jgi:AbrB family looped-hinge helix DNA binding protein